MCIVYIYLWLDPSVERRVLQLSGCYTAPVIELNYKGAGVPDMFLLRSNKSKQLQLLP